MMLCWKISSVPQRIVQKNKYRTNKAWSSRTCSLCTTTPLDIAGLQMSTGKKHSSTGRLVILIAKHKTTLIRSILVLVVFVIYLPFVYQIHLDILAQLVIYDALWPSQGLYLFPIPVDLKWFPFTAYTLMYVTPPLSIGDRLIYDYFVPNVGLRLLWSALWLLLGLAYISAPYSPV